MHPKAFKSRPPLGEVRTLGQAMASAVLRWPAKINRVHFPVINSTNAWARDNAAKLDSVAMTVVTADHQTGGEPVIAPP